MNESKHSVRDIFAEALEISDSSQRSAFLDQACGMDGGLRREVEELLQAEADAGMFLPDKPAATTSRSALQELANAAHPFGAIPPTTLTEKPGDRIGRYELLEKLGEGGCGVVYLAQQETPVRRQVALKIIKLGMDTRQVIARFEAERQALAMMDHPNIAKVFDAGATDTGRSFFVMELVRGITITDYCTQHQLSTRERLVLFIQVCQAVQHAHQKGIIHRDLKPSNILVTENEGVPVPKVIDFGIAKATEGKLTDQTLFTAFEQFLGTPAYMSPEQAAMTSGDIDTRSDIYSLGVLLYELLTGTTPFDTKTLLASGVDELRRTIREKSPVRPSTRLRQAKLTASPSPAVTRHSPLATDLDWIVMKCLEKDRLRRYETANGLANDLKRHLDNEPVIARPPSRLYEFQKTVRRHKVGFAATAAVIVALVTGVIISTWEAIRATRFRRQAEAETYTSDMNLAKQAWDEGNLRRAVGLLTNYFPKPGEPDLRGFEWRYLWNLSQDESLHTVEFPKDDQVRRLAATPAHSFVAAACEKTIRLLEPSTGRELARLPYPNPEGGDPHPLVALAAGMTNLLAGYRGDGVVGVWDLASRKPPLTFQPFTNNVGVLALSPDGKYLAAADQDRLGYYGTVLAVWDISSLSQSRSPVWTQRVDSAGVLAMTFSPDGQFLVNTKCKSGVGANLIEIWESKTGRGLAPILNASAANIYAVAFSPDGTLLAAPGGAGRLNVWDFTSRALKFPLDGLADVDSVVFSADGTQLFSGGYNATIRRWDVSSQRCTGLWRFPQAVELTMALAPDGKSIVSATPGEVRIWDAAPREEESSIKVLSGWSWPIVSPDGKYVIVADPDDLTGSNGAGVWDIASGQHKFDLFSEGMLLKSFAFSPDGRLLAASSLWKDGLVGIWDTAAWDKGESRMRPFIRVTNGFESACVCFSPDGKILASSGFSMAPFVPKEPSGATNRLTFWEVGSWKKLNLLPEAGVGVTEWAAANSVDFSSDGHLLAVGSRDGLVRLYDFKKQKLLKESEVHAGEDQWGEVVRFSPDSRWLASYRLGWASVVLWDLADPQNPRAVWLGADEVAGLHWALFAPDNKSLICASNDGLIKFWNLRTGKVALTLRHDHGPGGFLAMARDGTFFVSKDANDTVKIWKAPLLEEIDRKRKSP